MLENHQVELVLHWENDVSHIEPGSDLSGFIMMNVAKVIQARAVTFRFTGEKVTEVAHNWQAEIFRGRSGRPPSYNFHSIIDMNIPLEHYSLFRNGPGGSRLSPGQYQLSFHISLPDYLPDTKDWSEDGISSVSYDVKANLDYAYLDSSGSIVLRKYCLTRPVIVKEEDQFPSFNHTSNAEIPMVPASLITTPSQDVHATAVEMPQPNNDIPMVSAKVTSSTNVHHF